MKKTVVITFLYILCVQKAHSIDHTATIGQDVQIPCGIHSVQNVTRLVWKFGQSVSHSVQFAFMYDGSSVCDNNTKACELNDNGDLVIHNVMETDGNDRYFCFLNDDNYYAEHTLNIHPEVICPSLAAVTIGVTPTCTNGNAGGSICNYQCNTGFEIRSVSMTCSSVTGTWNGTEPTCVQTNRSVPCSCASVTTGGFFLGFVVGFIIESVLVLFIYKWYRRRKKEHTKPQFTTRLELQMTAIQGQKLELTCSVNGQTTPTILWYKDGKHLDSQAGYKTTLDGVAKLTFPSIRGSDEGMYSCIVVNPAGDDITSCNVAVTGTTQADDGIMQQNSIHQDSAPPDTTDGTIMEDAVSEETPLAPQESVNNQGSSPGFGSQVQSRDVGMLESGQPLASVTETGNDAEDCTDGNMQGAIKKSHQTPEFGGMKELVVKSDTPKFRILPSVAKPSDGIEMIPAESHLHSNLDFYLHHKDGVPIPDITFIQQTHGLSTNVAELVTLPVHVTCGKCRESCCLLEVYGGEYSDMKEESYCKEKCAKDGQNKM